MLPGGVSEYKIPRRDPHSDNTPPGLGNCNGLPAFTKLERASSSLSIIIDASSLLRTSTASDGFESKFVQRTAEWNVKLRSCQWLLVVP